jgi:hypothetical protein
MRILLACVFFAFATIGISGNVLAHGHQPAVASTTYYYGPPVYAPGVVTTYYSAPAPVVTYYAYPTTSYYAYPTTSYYYNSSSYYPSTSYYSGYYYPSYATTTYYYPRRTLFGWR